MILKLIHNNKIGAYAFMLLTLIALWIKSLIISPTIIAEASLEMPLWKLFSFTLNSNWVSLLFSFISVVVITLAITRFISKYSLLSKPSALPGFLFIAIIGSFPIVQRFHPMWLVAILFMVSLDYLFSAYNARKTMKECFVAMFLMSAASLFAYKAIVLIPLLFISMTTLRVMSFKSLLASLIGFVLPWLLLLGFELAFGELVNLSSYVHPTIDRFFHYYNHTPVSIGIIILMVLIAVFSFFSALSEYGKKKIFTRKQYEVFLYATIYIMVIMTITGTSIEFLPIMAVSFSILMAHFIDNITSWLWQNIVLISLVIGMLLGQLFL